MIVTLSSGQPWNLNLPLPPRLRNDHSALATLRAFVELELAGEKLSQRAIAKYIREHGLYSMGENSATIVARAIERLSEAGLLYERRGSNRSTQYLSIVTAKGKSNGPKTGPVPETGSPPLSSAEETVEVQRSEDPDLSIQV